VAVVLGAGPPPLCLLLASPLLLLSSSGSGGIRLCGGGGSRTEPSLSIGHRVDGGEVEGGGGVGLPTTPRLNQIGWFFGRVEREHDECWFTCPASGPYLLWRV